MADSILKCFKCGVNIPVDEASQAILGAMSFISYGGYGSSYDPLSPDKWIRIHVCDRCVNAGAGEGVVLEAERVRRRPEVKYRRYSP
jgi:hypothetical protein